MAKVLRIDTAVLRGSIGGTVYSANQYSPIIARARTTPTNPRTVSQMAIRNGFAAGVQAWNALTEDQRSAWIEWGATVERPGPVGPYHPGGRQLFIAQYSFFSWYDANKEEADPVLLPKEDGPTIPGEISLDSVTAQPLTDPGTGFEIKVELSTGGTTLVTAIRSVAYNPAKSAYTGPFKSNTLGFVAMNPPDDDVIPFTGLTDGLRYFAAVRAVTTGTGGGRMSQLYIIPAIASVTPGP